MITAKRVRFWYRVHKWTSLICTAFLLTACMTGLPLIFHDELDAMLSHDVRPSEAPPNTPTVSLDQIAMKAKQEMPGLQPYAVGFDDDEPRIFVTMTPTPKPEGFRVLYFDQHTGRFLNSNDPQRNLVTFILNLHRELFLGLSGELLMGAMALLFVISLISGAFVYGPFMRRLDFGTYRRHAARRVRWFDLHNLVGIVALAWALVVGLTGVMNALSAPLFGVWRAQTIPALLAPYRGQPMPTHFGSVDAAVAEAERTLPGMQVTSVLFPNAIVSSPRHYVVWTHGKTPVTSRLFTPVLIDATTGTVTVAKGLPWYLRALEVSRPLHFGDYGGMPLKIIWALFDVALIAVLLSGVYLWLSRRKTPVEDELDRLVKLEKLAVEETPIAGVLAR